MTEKIYSVNALSTLTGIDRRTLARALQGIEPDGRLRSGAGWSVGTAQDALANLPDARRTASRPTRARNHPLLSIMIERLECWREIHAKGRKVMTLAEVANLMGVLEGDVLMWLRAGLPYAEAGDFATGQGFKLVPSWTIDWLSAIRALADDSTARRLRI